MAEFDTITLHNPTTEDFTQRFNGEPYTIKAKEEKTFAQSVGLHLAKHLAHRLVTNSFSQKDKNDVKKSIKIRQKLIYDNPLLRISLYKILRNVDLVGEVITHYNYKGFVGDMDEYKDFVEKEETKSAKKEEPKSKKVAEKTSEK